MIDLLLALTLTTQDPSVPPTVVVQEFLGALNRGDAEGALDLLHESYTFRDSDGHFSIPKEGVRPMIRWDVATNARSEVEEVRVHRDDVVVSLRESNDFLELLGLAPFRHEARFVVRNGTLRATVVQDTGIGSDVQRALEPVLAWARQTDPQALEGLVTDGDAPVYDGDSAEGWLRLLHRTRDAGVLPRHDDEPR